MPFNNKVIWKEGMFIRAQHFQQNGRYFESFVRGRVSGLRSYGWGITDLAAEPRAAIDRDGSRSNGRQASSKMGPRSRSPMMPITRPP